MWLVLHRRQLARLMPGLLTAVVLLVDLALFNGFTQGSPDPHGATSNNATADALAAFVAAQGPGPPPNSAAWRFSIPTVITTRRPRPWASPT